MPKPRVNPTKAVLKPVMVCRETLSDLTGLSESLIEAKIRAGTFPKPRQASERRVAWLLREIEEWAEKLPVSDLPPPENSGRRSQ